ncbi:MAG: hypothetical protein ABI467_25155, partial [Kofleriaceae bacterium]
PEPRHYFSDGRVAGQDGVLVRVEPVAAERWIGIFAFGSFRSSAATRVLSMPNPDVFCVVAKGAGYLVSAAKPDVWEAVLVHPVIDVRAIAEAGLVIFTNFTELMAYGAQGVRWRTKRLAWDGLKIVSIGDRTLLGEYWDMRTEAVQQFEVELATGASRGGVEP